MPKCEVDFALQDQVRRFVRDNGLTVNGAATLLGVNRTTFWRFHETGEALGRTKVRIRDAIANRNNRAAVRVADDAVASDATELQFRPLPEGALADREIKQIRKACEGLLTLLNAYEAQQSLARKV